MSDLSHVQRLHTNDLELGATEVRVTLVSELSLF